MYQKCIKKVSENIISKKCPINFTLTRSSVFFVLRLSEKEDDNLMNIIGGNKNNYLLDPEDVDKNETDSYDE